MRKCDKESDDCGIRDVRDMDMEEKGLCEEAKGEGGQSGDQALRDAATDRPYRKRYRSTHKDAESRCEPLASHELPRQLRCL